MKRVKAANKMLDINRGSPLSVAVEERDRNTLSMVRDALRDGRTLLAFQPIVQTARPERPAFYEGLIRVIDSTGRIIPANDFMDVVEADELGRLIDVASLRHGLRTLRDVPDLRLSINMSARSIGYGPWLSTLRRGLDSDATIAERLILEITERSAIVVPEHVQSFMAEFQDRGISFAIDDFGAGQTSLRYMRDFYFDILKIDGDFVRGLETNPDNQVLIRALLSLARHFDMFTVAEHVETAAEAEVLASLGVDCLQGYYFGLPTTKPFWLSADERRAV